MDIIILTMNNPSQRIYWQKEFDKKERSDRITIVIEEDWEGGAGSGLGTLYAFKKANGISQKQHGFNLFEQLCRGDRVSIFHCAGFGKRLYPLTASENNNKSAIKIPSRAGSTPLIEKLIAESLALIQDFSGRLFVFWGDQFILPSKPLKAPEAHVEILAQVFPTPSEQEWKERGLERYGLLLFQSDDNAKLVEKIAYSDMIDLTSSGFTLDKIALSLGSFSLSKEFLEILLSKFRPQLEKKEGRLNSDYHFWMALTWEKKSYIEFMMRKGYDFSQIVAPYEAMQEAKERLKALPNRQYFGVTDIGEKGIFWDMGSLDTFFNNMHSLLTCRESGAKLVELFGIEQFYHRESNSFIIDSEIGEGYVKNSLLVGVKAKELQCNNSVIINCSYSSFTSNHSFSYNVMEKTPLSLNKGDVRSDLLLSKSPYHIPLYTTLLRNGKEDWEKRLPKNSFTYREVQKFIAEEDPS